MLDHYPHTAPAAARAEEGHGLGLPLSRTIARRSGGDLALEPSERGARFVLTLPRATGETTPAARSPRGTPHDPTG